MVLVLLLLSLLNDLIFYINKKCILILDDFNNIDEYKEKLVASNYLEKIVSI